MSRVGKKPIQIPDKVEVLIKGQDVTVKGPKGEFKYQVAPEVSVSKKDGQVCLTCTGTTKQAKALWGLWRALLRNAVLGVSQGFQKELEIRGVGYGAQVQGNTLELNLGFSHPIKVEIPEDISVTTQKNEVVVQGIDKQKVGQFAAQIRAYRKPDPYKGKGVRYKGEKVRQKEGKKAVTA